MNEQSIIDQLYTLLSGVNNVKTVYKGIAQNITQYPAIMITPDGWENEFESLRDTIVNMSFKIYIYVDLEGDALGGQDILRQIVKDVRETLGSQNNITLNGLVDSSRLTSGRYSFDQKETMLGVCEIDYRVRKLFNRY